MKRGHDNSCAQVRVPLVPQQRSHKAITSCFSHFFKSNFTHPTCYKLISTYLKPFFKNYSFAPVLALIQTRVCARVCWHARGMPQDGRLCNWVYTECANELPPLSRAPWEIIGTALRFLHLSLLHFLVVTRSRVSDSHRLKVEERDAGKRKRKNQCQYPIARIRAALTRRRRVASWWTLSSPLNHVLSSRTRRDDVWSVDSVRHRDMLLTRQNCALVDVC